MVTPQVAHEGKVRRRQAEQQTDQILCLNLVTNAVVTWNTVYMDARWLSCGPKESSLGTST